MNLDAKTNEEISIFQMYEGSLKFNFHDFVFLSWVNGLGDVESELVDSWALNSVETDDSVILWNVNQMIATSRASEMRWFVALVGNEGQWVDSVSWSVLDLIDVFAFRNSPDSLPTS